MMPSPPGSPPKRRRQALEPISAHKATPTDSVAPQMTLNDVIYPVTTIGVLGAPFCDGQNLEGADLAPAVLRETKLEVLVRELGYDWQDHGDLDFQKRYLELGLSSPRQRTTRDDWHAWLKNGSHKSFSEWIEATRPDAEKSDEEKMTPAERVKAIGESVYDHVVNAHLVGPAIELIYKRACDILSQRQFLLTIGGDHSIATGTITAVAEHYGEDLAVIWVDAHGDANTPEISPSLHYHGMPAAHVLGWFARHPKGFEWMPRMKSVDARNMAYIGLRDIDREEGELMRKSDLHIYTMREVDKWGIGRVIEMALDKVDPNRKRPIHLSLDVDAIDPQFAPGTGTTARGGLTYREIHYICEELALTRRLVSMDLVEINPGLEPKPQGRMHGDDPRLVQTTPTVQLGAELVLSALGKTIMHC